MTTTNFQHKYIGSIYADGELYITDLITDGGLIVYMAAAGTRESLRALRGRLKDGESFFVNPPNGEAIPIIAATTPYQHLERRADRRVYHMISTHRHLQSPLYIDDKERAFVIAATVEQRSQWLYHHIKRLIHLPLQPDWIRYIETEGRREKLIYPLKCRSQLTGLAIKTDRASFERIITSGIRRQAISF
jgi:hypothetical protein